MEGPTAAGAALAQRHRVPAPPDPEGSLANYAESTRTGDWSLRSALVRLAQPEPVRAGAVLELIRRCDGSIHPYVRLLEPTTVWCDRSLTMASVEDEPGRPYPDARAADLARMVRSSPADADAVLAGYADQIALADDERTALPLLAVALELDHLGDVLAAWADAGPDDPPLDVVDDVCRNVFERLGSLGVPRQTGPPRRGQGG